MLVAAPTEPLTRRARTGRFWAVGLAVSVAAITAAPVVSSARTAAEPRVETPAPAGGYVTTTTSPTTSLDVSAFSPECVRDAPFINYTIVPVGFTPIDGSATLVIRAADGSLVETTQVTSLSGQLIWPGAEVDPSGNTVDWPGWKVADDGVSWIPDPTDARLREGLVIEVTVNASAVATVTASATVAYPPANSPCANPPSQDPLPQTGGGPGNLVVVGAAALLAGVLLVTSARRRHRGVSPTG